MLDQTLNSLSNNPAFYPEQPGQVSIAIAHLVKKYGKPGANRATNGEIIANDDISLEVVQGEIFGLLGPNGAGKTTLVNQIMGLTSPTSGDIFVEDIDVVQSPQLVKRLTAYLPQKGLPFGSLEVSRALIYTGRLRGLKPVEAQHQAQTLLKELDLEEVSRRFVNTLSSGMQRMVGFATALMGRPRLLILDEPTNELDPARRRQVWEAIRTVNRERGTTCLLVTHNLIEAESVLERLAVISKGKIIAAGTPGEIKQSHSNEAYLDLVLTPEIFNGSEDNGQHSTAIIQVTKLLATANLQNQVRIEQTFNQPLRVRLYLLAEQASQVINLFLQGSGRAYVDDFKLALPSLEDVYLQLISGNAQTLSSRESVEVNPDD